MRPRPEFFSGIRKTWSNESLSSNWEGEVKLDDKIFFVNCNYDLDYTVDDGDDLTPPSTTINDVSLRNVEIYADNEETGEFDIEITEFNSPTLYKALLLKIEEEIVNYEYEWL